MPSPFPFGDYLHINNSENSETPTTNSQIYFPPLKENQELEKECGICREEFTSQAQVKPCNHIMDFTCLQNWLATELGNGINGCPICRARIKEIHHSFTSSGELTTLEVDISKPVERRRPEAFTVGWYEGMAGQARGLGEQRYQMTRQQLREVGEEWELESQTLQRLQAESELLQREEDARRLLRRQRQAEWERSQREHARQHRQMLRDQQIRQLQEDHAQLQGERDAEQHNTQLQIQQLQDEQVLELIDQRFHEDLERVGEEGLEFAERQYQEDLERFLRGQNARQYHAALQNQPYGTGLEPRQIEQMECLIPLRSRRGYEWPALGSGDEVPEQEAIDPVSPNRESTSPEDMGRQDVERERWFARLIGLRDRQLELTQQQLFRTRLLMNAGSPEEFLDLGLLAQEGPRRL